MASSHKPERPLSFAQSFAPNPEEFGYIEQNLSQLPPKAILPNRHSTNDQSFYPQEDEAIMKETEPETKGEEAEIAPFKPGYRFYMAFSSLAVLAMMVSLDGTSVSVALPVSHSIL